MAFERDKDKARLGIFQHGAARLAAAEVPLSLAEIFEQDRSFYSRGRRMMERLLSLGYAEIVEQKGRGVYGKSVFYIPLKTEMLKELARNPLLASETLWNGGVEVGGPSFDVEGEEGVETESEEPEAGSTESDVPVAPVGVGMSQDDLGALLGHFAMMLQAMQTVGDRLEGLDKLDAVSARLEGVERAVGELAGKVAEVEAKVEARPERQERVAAAPVAVTVEPDARIGLLVMRQEQGAKKTEESFSKLQKEMDEGLSSSHGRLEGFLSSRLRPMLEAVEKHVKASETRMEDVRRQLAAFVPLMEEMGRAARKVESQSAAFEKVARRMDEALKQVKQKVEEVDQDLDDMASRVGVLTNNLAKLRRDHEDLDEYVMEQVDEGSLGTKVATASDAPSKTKTDEASGGTDGSP